MENRKKILIVDDDPVVRKVLSARLTSHQFQVVEAGSGSSGIALAREEHPDLILLDVVMPSEDGIQVCAALKQDSATEGIPIIFLTGLSCGLEPFKNIGAQRNSWMFGKPYNPDELLKAIRQILEETTPDQPSRGGAHGGKTVPLD